MQKLNFSSLGEPTRLSRVRSLLINLRHLIIDTASSVNLTYLWVFVLFFILSAVATLAAGVFISIFNDPVLSFAYRTYSWIFILPIFGLSAAIVFALRSRIGKSKEAKLQKFAADNNIMYSSRNTAYGMTGFIFNIGDSQLITDRFIFPDGTDVANYEYTSRFGRSIITNKWSYVRINLKRRIPHLVLDSKRNNFVSKISNLPIQLHKSQTLGLEGDFDKYYTLYTPSKYEADSLYVLTPDVMQAMIDIDRISAFDMEAIDNNFYFYRKGHFRAEDPNEWVKITKAIQTIQPKLDKQTHFYLDEKVGDRSLDRVAVPGKRLRSKLSINLRYRSKVITVTVRTIARLILLLKP